MGVVVIVGYHSNTCMLKATELAFMYGQSKSWLNEGEEKPNMALFCTVFYMGIESWCLYVKYLDMGQWHVGKVCGTEILIHLLK